MASDLCQRAGGKAYISGSIANLGSQYVIGLDAVNCKTGDPLAQEQVTAENKEHILKALDAQRRNLGRNSASPSARWKNSTLPLDQATTPSLEALKALSEGIKTLQEKGSAAAIPFFNHAIELDPNFAAAYGALGISYSNLREPGLANENLQKAYDLRDKVSETRKISHLSCLLSSCHRRTRESYSDLRTVGSDLSSQQRTFRQFGSRLHLPGTVRKGIAASLEDLRLNPRQRGCLYQSRGSVSCGKSSRRVQAQISAGHRAQSRQPVPARESLWSCISSERHPEMQRQLAATSWQTGRGRAALIRVRHRSILWAPDKCAKDSRSALLILRTEMTQKKLLQHGE